MDISVAVNIAKPKELVWQAIIDIDHCMDMISSIITIEVINRPDTGLVGLKWQETRIMFGKEAAETMWITEAAEYEYYKTRAESHGSVYLTCLSLTDADADSCTLTMSFEGQAQTISMKVLSFLMTPFMQGSMKKMLLKDLNEIKAYVENSNG